MSFLQSSKQKPSIYAHTELLHPAGQIPPVSWQQCALVDLTLLEVLKCFQVCWDQTHNVMFFLISNYPIVKTTWGFQNVSSHWPLLNKALFFYNVGHFHNDFFSFLDWENIILASRGHPVIHRPMFLTQQLLSWGGGMKKWIGEGVFLPFLQGITGKSPGFPTPSTLCSNGAGPLLEEPGKLKCLKYKRIAQKA